MDDREKDIQNVISKILSMSPDSTGDYGPGGTCPFCFGLCSIHDDLKHVNHDPDCIYLIAKDLSTNFK